jgi:hypothetical protein
MGTLLSFKVPVKRYYLPVPYCLSTLGHPL